MNPAEAAGNLLFISDDLLEQRIALICEDLVPDIFNSPLLRLSLRLFEIGFVWVCFGGVRKVGDFRNPLLRLSLRLFWCSGNWVCFA